MEQPVPKGPLAVRWQGLELGPVRAGAVGAAVVRLENAGSAAWRTEDDRTGVLLSYHWLDERGNPIVWDGIRTALERTVAPGERLETELRIRGPIPPGRYRLAVDLVDEGRLWFEEIGNARLERDLDVLPRIERAAEAVAYLAEGVEPAPDWSRRVFGAHQEGYAVVAGSVEVETGLLRRVPRELEPYRPGGGRVPSFPHPLVCPSVVKGVEVEWTEVAGLPAALPPRDEPWIYDGRVRVRARPRSGRRRG
jgi:hypothetical protein